MLLKVYFLLYVTFCSNHIHLKLADPKNIRPEVFCMYKIHLLHLKIVLIEIKFKK